MMKLSRHISRLALQANSSSASTFGSFAVAHVAATNSSSARIRYFSTNPPPSSDDTSAAEHTGAEDATGSAEAIHPDQALIEKLEKEVKDLKQQVLRCYAEEENVRRIAKRDVDNARSYANSSFAKSMLEVADNLERALQAVPAEKKTSTEDAVFKSLIEGIEMTEKNLVKTFSKFGVKKFGAVGDSFDPDLHEALFRIPDPTKEAGKIGQVLKTGYKLHDRVIRAAEVGTIVSPDE